MKKIITVHNSFDLLCFISININTCYSELKKDPYQLLLLKVIWFGLICTIYSFRLQLW